LGVPVNGHKQSRKDSQWRTSIQAKTIITGFITKPACLSCAEKTKKKEHAQKAVGRPKAHGFFILRPWGKLHGFFMQQLTSTNKRRI